MRVAGLVAGHPLEQAAQALGLAGGQQQRIFDGLGVVHQVVPCPAIVPRQMVELDHVQAVAREHPQVDLVGCRPIVDHMFRNYDGVLKVDSEVGNKKTYEPRAWGKIAETGMAARVVQACQDLRSAGTSPAA